MKDLASEFMDQFSEQVNSIKKDGIKRQIPNMLTFSRILSPLAIIPLSVTGHNIIALGLLIIFALTDYLDGIIARKFNYITKFGATLDTISDKMKWYS